MTTACLCEVGRPGLVTALAGRGIGVEYTEPHDLASVRAPAGCVLVAAATAGDMNPGWLRRAWPGPVLLVIAGAREADLARALDAGAADAVSDRAGDALLAARIAALARRGSAAATVSVGGLVIDLIGRAVTRDGRRLELLPREYEVLLHLARAVGRTVTREELRAAVWGIGFDPGTNAIEVHVSRLRSKLDRGPAPPMLLTDRGRGYRLAAEDERAD
ncbi:MAG: winged helix-turn-helix domain-containing protein [Sphingomonas sp.]